MEALHIEKLVAKYHLPASAQAERARFDRVLRMVLDEALDEALERLAVPVNEEVCIRGIYVPVRLRRSESDVALAKAWAAALAAKIKIVIQGSSLFGIVHFTSRTQAMIDLAVGVATNNFTRSWAWRQLRLWRAGEHVSGGGALDEFVRSLFAEPSMIIPVLSALAERSILNSLASRFAVEHWMALASGALAVTGITVSSHLSAISLLPDRIEAPARHVTPRTLGIAQRMMTTSHLARSFISLPSSTFDSQEITRAVATLIMLETNPALFRAQSEMALILVHATARLLRSQKREDSDNLEILEGDVSEPEHARATLAGDTRLPEKKFAEDARLLEEAATEGARLSVTESTSEEAADELPLPKVRKRAMTRYGGVLFLLGLTEDIGLPEELAIYAAQVGRPFRWLLHQLALALIAMKAHDPAALAFAGLPPGDTPPTETQAPPTEMELAAVNRFAQCLAARLRDRLERHEQETAELMEFVCYRRAEIVADPGWIEAHFSLDDVDTELRRAGLDLNPDYLPWLGAAVRFVYE